MVLYQMVAHFTMRTYGVNLEFRFVEGISVHRKSRKIRVFSWKCPILHHTCATCSELPSYMSTMTMLLFYAFLTCLPIAPAIKFIYSRRE